MDSSRSAENTEVFLHLGRYLQGVLYVSLHFSDHSRLVATTTASAQLLSKKQHIIRLLMPLIPEGNVPILKERKKK